MVLEFTKKLLETNNGEPILELLLDCMDSPARNAVGDLCRWLIAKCKMIEINELKGDNHADTVCSKFLTILRDNLKTRAAKSWNRFDKYLELFQAFAL